MMATLFWLIVAHAICDYPLQGDWLSKAKNPLFDLVPGEQIWQLALASHALIHAGAVQLITGSWPCAVVEFIMHFSIDYVRCKKEISYNGDQLMHIGCKVWYVAMIIGGLA